MSFEDRSMGDSETECSLAEDECESPILYSTNHASTVVQSQVLQSQSETQGVDAIFALSQLDSLLDQPAPRLPRTVLSFPPQGPTKFAEGKVAQHSGVTKVRTLDQILQQLSRFFISRANLMHHLDIGDMRLLIHACGERVNSKATKAILSDKLLQLLQEGALNKYCNSLGLSALHVNHNIAAPLVRQPSQGASETQAEAPVISGRESTTHSTRVETTTAAALLTAAAIPPAAVQTQALFVADDPSLWAPVADESLLEALGEAPQRSVSAFPPLPQGSSIYFASTTSNTSNTSTLWQPCSADLQAALNETDPAYVSKRMLQKLHSTEGVFSALPVAPVAVEPPHGTSANHTTAHRRNHSMTMDCEDSDLSSGGHSIGGHISDGDSESTDATYDLSTLVAGPAGTKAAFAESARSSQKGCDHVEVLHSLRRKLLPCPPGSAAGAVASAGSGPSGVGGTTAGVGAVKGPACLPGPPLPPGVGANTANRNDAAGQWVAQYDCIKLATFKQAKLGLSLVREAGATGREYIVIQSKNHAMLDAAVDKLLSIGDVLATVNGVDISACGMGFNEQLSFLREVPRPVTLGFVPAGALHK